MAYHCLLVFQEIPEVYLKGLLETIFLKNKKAYGCALQLASIQLIVLIHLQTSLIFEGSLEFPMFLR